MTDDGGRERHLSGEPTFAPVVLPHSVTSLAVQPVAWEHATMHQVRANLWAS